MIVGIFVDCQEDFVNGVLGTPEAKDIIPYIKKETHSNRYDFMFFTQDWHDTTIEQSSIESKRVPCHTPAGQHGAVIIQGIIPSEKGNWRIIQKDTFGTFALPDLIMDESYGYGEPVEEIHIMGVCTDICVISNALILRSAFPNIPIYVHANGCAGSSPEAHDAALKVMTHCCIDILEEV